MTEIGTGEVPIFPVFKGFRSEVVTEVDSTGQESGNRFSSAFGAAVKGIGAGIAIGVGAAVAGAAAIASKGLDRALNIQDAKAQLTGLGHDAESVSAIMGSALDSVRGTAFGLDSAATIAASSVAAGIAPGEALTRTLKLTADAATIGKASLSEMGDMVNKVATNGKLTTDVLQQFQGRGIPLLKLVADQYGVTAEEASKMVTRGEVDFATFQNALEAGVGGAALASGATARGAFKNIGAAFGRMGAMFVQPAVDGAPTLFMTIAAAIDRATTSAKPLSDLLAAKLGPAMTSVGSIVDGINFDTITSKLITVYQAIVGIFELVANGSFTTEFAQAFNVTEDSAVVDVLFRIRDGIIGVTDLIVGGNFSAKFADAFNVQEDSPVVDFLLTARQAVVDFFAAVGNAFATGDFSQITDSLGGIGAALNPLFPIFVQVGQGLGAISGNIGGLIAAGLPLLAPIIDTFTGALGYLSDNSELIAPIITTIVVAMGAYKLAQAAANVAALASLPIEASRTAAMFASAAANNRLAAATLTAAGADKASLASKLPATGAVILNTAAAIGNAIATGAVRVAQLAGAAAMGIATAAQWALNAAMSANPIAIIVIAIAALVAGLIWFFTQTELGQQVWANFTRFLTEAWANIVAVATAVFTALGEFFSTIWNFIVAVVTTYINLVLLVITTVVTAIVTAWTATWDFVSTVISTVWAFIVGVVTAYINLVMTVILAVVGAIVSVWTSTWDAISSVITTVWDFIVSFVTTYINTVMAIITAVVGAISSTWNSAWSGISEYFSSIWNAIVSFVSGAVDGVASTITSFVSSIQNGVEDVVGFITGLPDQIMGVLGNLGDLLVDSGKALIQGFIDGISGMIGGLGDAVNGVMDFVGGFFPHSPAKRGPFSGAGWTQLKKSGAAIGDQFAAGLESVEPALTAQLNAMQTMATVGITPSTASRAVSASSADTGRSVSIETNIYPQETDPVVLGIIQGRTIVEQLAGM